MTQSIKKKTKLKHDVGPVEEISSDREEYGIEGQCEVEAQTSQVNLWEQDGTKEELCEKFWGYPELLHKYTRNQQKAKVIIFNGLITEDSKTTSDIKAADKLCNYFM